MHDLRLIGVDDDGGHLLLADVSGTRFRVPLDESLRAAARRDRPRMGQLLIEIQGGVRPRDIQAMVRAGLTAHEVAERSGWTIDKIQKYEGPILAEREYVAGLGQAVRLRRRTSSGPTVTLAQRVLDRLTDRGVPVDSVEWDAWRREGPDWTVTVTFTAGGRQRRATWSFDVPSRSVQAKDDEARWLSEDEPAAAPPAGEVPVYDVEADGGLDAAAVARARSDSPVDLVTAMRERTTARSRRVTARRRALEPVAALPLGDVLEDPAEQPRTSSPVDATDIDTGDIDTGDIDAADVDTADVDAASPDAPEQTREPAVRRHTPRRSGRPSVPSWDDIVFGTKSRSPEK